MVTASSHVLRTPSPRPDASVAVHDSDHEKYKMVLEMMRAQREEATRLAPDCLAEIENARADWDVANATMQCRNTSLFATCEEAEKLRDELARVNIEAGALSSLRGDNDKLHNVPEDSDAEITRRRELLMAIRDTASGELPSS